VTCRYCTRSPLKVLGVLLMRMQAVDISLLSVERIGSDRYNVTEPPSQTREHVRHSAKWSISSLCHTFEYKVMVHGQFLQMGSTAVQSRIGLRQCGKVMAV
jgi:hypothetical protein